MISKTILNVHRIGQGKDGYKTPVLFPKLVFLYDKNLHGKDKELYEVYKTALLCSSKTMYPDWLSLTGEGYVSDIYKNTGKLFLQWVVEPSYRRGTKEEECIQLMKKILLYTWEDLTVVPYLYIFQ